ncbi:hypothetical protein I546_3367 [Mycobacterium kansasii 732]|nr:hypothetical protein I546_3367 [Mycobacterium kansasii 732]
MSGHRHVISLFHERWRGLQHLNLVPAHVVNTDSSGHRRPAGT